MSYEWLDKPTIDQTVPSYFNPSNQNATASGNSQHGFPQSTYTNQNQPLFQSAQQTSYQAPFVSQTSHVPQVPQVPPRTNMGTLASDIFKNPTYSSPNQPSYTQTTSHKSDFAQLPKEPNAAAIFNYFSNSPASSNLNSQLPSKPLNVNNPFRSTNNNTANSSALQNQKTGPAKLPLRETNTFQSSRSEASLYTINSTPGQPQNPEIPLALSTYQLSLEESKNYLRWYQYISDKSNFKSYVTLQDIFNFLKTNFEITDHIKKVVNNFFKNIKEKIGLENFYAVLRFISYLLLKGQIPTKDMLLLAAPVLKPKSILSKGEKEEVYEEIEDSQNDQPFDFDNFASLLLTGKSHRVKRVVKRSDNRPSKNVRFSEKLETFEKNHAPEIESPVVGTYSQSVINNLSTSSNDQKNEDSKNEPLDFSLPMDQLLAKLQQSKQPATKEEEEELADMKESLTHFQNLPKIDSVSLHIPSRNYQNSNEIEPLKPTATGSANHLFGQQPLQPTATGSANRLFGFSGNKSGLENSTMEPLKPTATGSANHLFSNQNGFSSSNANFNSSNPTTTFGNFESNTLKPTATGSANFYMKHSNDYIQSHPPTINSSLPANNTGNLSSNTNGYLNQVQLSPNHTNNGNFAHSSNFSGNTPSVFYDSAPNNVNQNNNVQNATNEYNFNLLNKNNMAENSSSGLQTNFSGGNNSSGRPFSNVSQQSRTNQSNVQNNNKASDYFSMLLQHNDNSSQNNSGSSLHLPNSISPPSLQQSPMYQGGFMQQQHTVQPQFQPQQPQPKQNTGPLGYQYTGYTNSSFQPNGTPQLQPPQQQQGFSSGYQSPNSTFQGNRPRTNSTAILGDMSQMQQQLNNIQNNRYGNA